MRWTIANVSSPRGRLAAPNPTAQRVLPGRNGEPARVAVDDITPALAELMGRLEPSAGPGKSMLPGRAVHLRFTSSGFGDPPSKPQPAKKPAAVLVPAAFRRCSRLEPCGSAAGGRRSHSDGVREEFATYYPLADLTPCACGTIHSSRSAGSGGELAPSNPSPIMATGFSACGCATGRD